MKFSVSSKTLYGYASAVQKVISSKNALLILNNFLFSIEGQKLTIVACDLENSVVATLDVCEVEGQGKFCIDAKRLTDLLKEIPEQPVTFDINDDNLELAITCTSGRYSLIAINGDEYPYNPDDALAEVAPEDILTFTAEAAALVKGIEYTVFAVSTDDLRPQMNGVLWDVHPADITFVATDTRQMARYIDSTIATGLETRFILPAKPANVLKTVFAPEGTIQVTCTPKNLTFRSDDFTFTCCLVKGNFPDYTRVIPQSTPYRATVDRQELLNAVKRLSAFVEGDNGLIKFKFTSSQLVMRASDAGMCSFGKEMVGCDFDGPETIMGFSGIQLAKILATIDSEEVNLSLIDAARPGVFTPGTQEPGRDLVMLVMPMAVNNFE